MNKEFLEGAKISFMDKKSSNLEKKVRKLEQEILQLDSMLEAEKLLLLERKMNSEDTEKSSVDKSSGDPPLMQTKTTHSVGNLNSSIISGKGDAPYQWPIMPVNIHRNEETIVNSQPNFFFTWDCTPHDFHNNSAQVSIYTLLDHWHPLENSMSTDQFKKELSALLAAHALKPPSPFQKKKGYENECNVDTKELFVTLEQKLKQVETKCKEEYLKIVDERGVNEIDEENSLLQESHLLYDPQEEVIDDLIFEIFNDPDEAYSNKSLELQDIFKEVDTLERTLKSCNSVGKCYNFQ